MPRFELDGNFDEVLRQIEMAAGDTKQAVEEAVKQAFYVITPKAENGIAKPYLPAGGKYSRGDSERSLNRTPVVTWDKDTGYVDVGFSVKKGGLPTIFMIYGTPRYMKNQVLYEAFYGENSKEAAYTAMADSLQKYLDKLIGG